MIANYPIQSAAFHLLLWSLDEIITIQEKEKWKSQMIAQIHDEILQDAVPSEVNHIAQVTEDVMTKKTRERFDWIHIPLLAEFSLSEINGSWAKMKKQDLINGKLVEKEKK
jgi:DNA polymerase I-like protein with 3'-5' exonuclease and polymerase domains